MLSTEQKRHKSIILNGIGNIVNEAELDELLKLDRPLIVKAGFDPTAPDLHLGHYVLIRKMKHFQDLGHEVCFLIGDFTGMIGDPTGKNITRLPLTREKLNENARTYAKQIFRILDPKKTKIMFNSSWMDKLDAAKMIEIASKYTLARLIERDDFSNRFNAGQPISIHELLYPLMQGYDSVAMKADIELGGNDQLFNLLVGRDLQRHYEQKPQVVITLPLLEGLDGVNKMSKSLNNYVAFEDSYTDMFGKIMSISDELMWKYYAIISMKTSKYINQMMDYVKNGNMNPRDLKLDLASEIVDNFFPSSEELSINSHSTGEYCKNEFIARFQKKYLDESALEIFNIKDEQIMLGDLLVKVGFTTSSSKAMKLIEQGAVKINDEKILDKKYLIKSPNSFILRSGKVKVAKIVL